MRNVPLGRLRPRYDVNRRDYFNDRVRQVIRPGLAVLDVGSGRSPSVSIDTRDGIAHYAGLDISRSELEAAPPGSYDEVVVSDVTVFVDELRDRFDLALSWQMLEHVIDLDRSLENVRLYLRPGGTFVAMFSGRFSVFGVLNALIPESWKSWLFQRLLGGARHKVFPAPYHHCWYSAIERATKRWSSAEIVPFYTAADYFRFSRPIQTLYLQYEDSIHRRDLRNLAPYYALIGKR
jgi:2-polyprenyl-6-hydroxyphenyl methylase/3-demethylubiquinone-9 3-methyltransferase